MDHESLRLAVALADTGDLARAGDIAGGLGKRTVTARIAQLERRVGAVLFDHSAKPVRLTLAGQAFVGEARLSLAASERAERLARAIAARPETIAIGATPAALYGPVRALVEDPAWAEAGLAPSVHEADGPEQLAALADGRLVLGFLTPPFAPTPRLAHCLTPGSKWSAVVPEADARLRKTVSLANLARKPLVMLDPAAAPLVHEGLIGALRATGAEPQVAQTARDWTSAMAMVALGLGSALVPSAIAKAVTMTGATVLPLVETGDLSPWPTACAWMPQPPGSRAAEAIDLVKRLFGRA
jgi:DNA-binding transcriptional LysR family regulator